jgi:hypothetical protein
MARKGQEIRFGTKRSTYSSDFAAAATASAVMPKCL